MSLIIEESKLIELCLQRNQNAWIVLIQRYKALIDHCLRSTFPGASPEEIKDLIQDVFYELVEDGLKRYNPEKSRFSTYLGLIAARCAVDYLRSKTFRERSNFFDLSECDHIESTSEDPTDKIFLDMALNTLTLEEYSLIYLRYNKEMSLESIAAIKKVNKSTILRRINKILIKLQEYATK